MIALFVVFTGAVHDAILPVPEEANPIVGLELTHAKDCAVGLLVKPEGVMDEPGQTVIGDNPVTTATGFTNT